MNASTEYRFTFCHGTKHESIPIVPNEVNIHPDYCPNTRKHDLENFNPGCTISIDSVRENDLRIAQLGSKITSIIPIPFQQKGLNKPKKVEFVGFGMNSGQGLGVKRMLPGTIVEESETHYGVGTLSGSLNYGNVLEPGDSGGPALAFLLNVKAVYGVHSGGSISTDIQTKVTPKSNWLIKNSDFNAIPSPVIAPKFGVKIKHHQSDSCLKHTSDGSVSSVENCEEDSTDMQWDFLIYSTTGLYALGKNITPVINLTPNQESVTISTNARCLAPKESGQPKALELVDCKFSHDQPHTVEAQRWSFLYIPEDGSNGIKNEDESKNQYMLINRDQSQCATLDDNKKLIATTYALEDSKQRFHFIEKK